MSSRPPESGHSPTPGYARPQLVVLPGGVLAPLEAEAPAVPKDVLEDYLDHLCAPLIGVVPYSERTRLRQETAFHLEQLVDTFVEEGVPEEQAVRQAVQKYGGSFETAQQFLEAWFSHQIQGHLARWIGLGNIRALVWFGLATLLTTSVLQAYVLYAEPHPTTLGLSIHDMRRLIPEPLPLPDANPLFSVFLLLTVVAPFFAGAMTGASVPVRPARAVYQVQTVLTLYTFAVGALLLPRREGMFLAFFQLLFWLPVGCLTAHIAAVLTWRRRTRFPMPL